MLSDQQRKISVGHHEILWPVVRPSHGTRLLTGGTCATRTTLRGAGYHALPFALAVCEYARGKHSNKNRPVKHNKCTFTSAGEVDVCSACVFIALPCIVNVHVAIWHCLCGYQKTIAIGPPPDVTLRDSPSGEIAISEQVWPVTTLPQPSFFRRISACSRGSFNFKLSYICAEMSLLPDKPRRGQAPTIVAMQVPANGDANTTRVYVFDREDNSDRKIELDSNMAVEKITTRLEIIHCLCSMLPIFSFGIMLGWPSPTYPNLLDPIYTAYPFDPVGNFSIPSDPDAPLRGPFMITMIQSPLIAGLLMIGVTVIAPFSSHAYTIYSIKHGLLIALLAMILGWITLWQAKNVFHLLVSRFLIGVGNGFAVGQVKIYIQHTSLPLGWKGRMLKMINIVMLSGAICAYMMGIWLDFDGFAVAALVITVVFYLLLLFIPLGNLGDSKVEYVGRQQEQNGNQPHLGVWPLFRTPNVRKSTWLLIALVFVQQFVGAPATIVYSQVLLLNLGLPTYMVPYCALVYILVYVMAYLVGTFYFCTLSYTKKRCILTLSTVCTILALVLNIVIICYELRDSHTYIPLVGMCVYIFVYGLGLGTIPNSFVEHLFEPQWRRPAGELQLMCFSMFALIITKLLQVFFGEFALEYLYVLFLSVGLAGLAFIVCCLPKKPLHY